MQVIAEPPIAEAEGLAMDKSGSLWIFAGAALLDIPGATLMGINLPKIPAQV